MVAGALIVGAVGRGFQTVERSPSRSELWSVRLTDRGWPAALMPSSRTERTRPPHCADDPSREVTVSTSSRLKPYAASRSPALRVAVQLAYGSPLAASHASGRTGPYAGSPPAVQPPLDGEN